jgi:two-component system, cell cycle response regulator DivK
MDLSKLKDKKILVVEDDPINRELITEIFEGTGVKLFIAITGTEAVAKCLNDTFDLILMDIQIPELNGYDATISIKKSKPGIPVIAQTAYAFASDRQKALESGCTDYIAKPFKKEELLTLVIKYIQ